MHRAVNINNLAQGPNASSQSFYGLGIAPKILDILERIKFKVPTVIQSKAIPLATEGKDVMGKIFKNLFDLKRNCAILFTL